MPLLVVDRIEGGYAVLTDGRTLADVPLAWLPADVAEGWHLRADFSRDADAEATRRADIADRIRRLSADDDGGDIDL
jgi:hypothetical protein